LFWLSARNLVQKSHEELGIPDIFSIQTISKNPSLIEVSYGISRLGFSRVGFEGEVSRGVDLGYKWSE